MVFEVSWDFLFGEILGLVAIPLGAMIRKCARN